MTIRVKAVKTLRYGGKKYDPGQVISMTPKYAQLFIGMKRAEKYAEKKVEAPKIEAPKVEVQKKVMEPAKAPAKEPPKSTLKSETETGRYSRRDMVAEEKVK